MADMFVKDGFNLGLVKAAEIEWPTPEWPHWHFYNYEDSVKYATKDALRLTPACRTLIELLAQTPVPPGYFPDLSLYGAGMHMICAGGFLGRHTDGDRHPTMGWYRKYNAILFLNECEGGEICIDGHRPIEPRAGRVLMFNSKIPHEVKEVTKGVRRSLSLFWWALEGTGEATCAQFS